MNDEIQKWFTEHGQVISADTVEDKASMVPGATLIQYTFADGAKLTVRAAKYDNGQMTAPQEIVSRELPKPKEEKPTPPSQQATTPRIEGTPTGRTNPDGTPEYDNSKPIMVDRDAQGNQVGPARALTQGERAQWEKDTGRAQPEAADRIGKPTGNTRQRQEGNTTVKETEYLLPDGTREWRTQTQTDAAQAADKVGKPTGNTRQATEGNRTVKETEYVLPDGTKEWRRQEETGEPGKKYAQVRQDEQTGQWFGLTPQGEWEPMQGGPGAGAGGVTLPPGMARPQFTAGEVTNALVETREKLDAWVAEGKDDAERASRKAEAVNAMKEAHQLATTYLTEQSQLQGTARDVFGTQVSQRGQDASMINQRTSAGASMANQAVSSFVPMLRYAQAGSGDPVAAFQALMGLMRGNVEQMGGLVDLPRVGVPSAIPQSARGQMQPSQTGTNTVGPQSLPPIVRGAAQQQQAAPGVTIQVNAPTPEQAAVPTPFAGQELPPPIFAPQPEATLPPPQVMQKVFDMVEPMMAQDPTWGVDDLGLIRQGVGPLG